MSFRRKALLSSVLATAIVVSPMQPVHSWPSVSATPWEVIDANMNDSLNAYRKGARDQAYLLSATAYLDGFELLEDRLKEVDYELMKTIEQGMEQLRDLMRQGAPLGVVEHQNGFVLNLLAQARDALDAQDDGDR